MIILIASVSAGISYVVASSFFGNISEQDTKVQTVDVIQSTIETPNEAIFNDDAINPSVEVNIDDTDADTSGDTTTDEAQTDTTEETTQ